MYRYAIYLVVLLLLACTQSQEETPIKSQNKTVGIEAYKIVPRVEAFSETVFGHQINDPYRWMEQGDKELRSWMVESASHTAEQLKRIPGRKRIHAATMKLLGGGANYYDVNQVGDSVFFMRRNKDESQASLFVRHNGQERLLVAPKDYQADDKTPAAIHNYSISPTGKHLAFHISTGGSEVGTMHFLDVNSGKVLADKLSPIWGEFDVKWATDNSMYVTMMTNVVKDDPLQGMQVVKHQLGGETSAPLLGYQVAGAPEYQPNEFPRVIPKNSDWEIGMATGARLDFRLLLRRPGEDKWHALIDYSDVVTSADIIDNHLYFITKKDAPNGRLMSLDLSNSLSIADAKMVVGDDEHILSSVTVVEKTVILRSMKDGFDLLRSIDKNGRVETIELPESGIISDMKRIAATKAFTFSVQNAKSARKYYLWAGDKFQPMGIQSFTHKSPAGFTVLREEAVSADGTKVPLTIYGTKESLKDLSPVALYSYGGYGISLRPYYRPMMYPLIEEGGLWVDCHVRGGGEKGRAWHEAGRGKNKPNGHADFIACAEHLIKTGRSTPKMIGGYGGSMAGALVGPAVLKRPDLFGHAILAVAILNPTRILASQNGMNQLGELGDPRTEEGYKAIFEMDAYEWLNRTEDYPDIMLDVGINDQRVELWNSGKFAGRYAARGRGGLLLIRADVEGGHGVGSSSEQRASGYADVYTFMLNRSGHPDFQLN